jgi:two-component sensor histidine kinase/ABC-type nitrate/sulfonate/bicarbonate transport system substrate-binding protein
VIQAYRPRIRLLAAIVAAALSAPAAGAFAADKVALQLKWRHQFQFAGYYMAKEKGYYDAAGLDVEIREASTSIRFTDEVVSGRAQYGVNNTDLLIDRVARGKKVVVLGVIFQHSPSVLVSLAKCRLDSPGDFVGKRVMVSPDTEAEIFSMFSNEGIPRDRIRFIPHSWNLEDLVEGRTDALTAYATNELLTLASRGIAYRVTKPITYGIDFYGDCLFSSDEEIRAHPKRAAAFLAASLKGWDYAMDHVGEACDLILEKYSREKPRAALLAEAAAMDELIVHKFVPIGFMNTGRWRHVGDTYVSLGMIPAGYSLDGFLYDPTAPLFSPRALLSIMAALSVAMIAAILYISILRAFNSRLASQVATRTAVLEELNGDLSREVAERREKERIIAESLAEKEVLLKEVHHRVKNNLQVVASLLNLQLSGFDDPAIAELLSTVRTRILSMALVHEHLYSGDSLTGIDVDEYLRSLVDEIVLSHQRRGLQVSSATKASGISLPIDRAIPLGLIVSELVMNSMKHAFGGRPLGRIEIEMERAGPSYLLRASDDGTGRTTEERGRPGIGLRLIEALCAQLGGSMREEPGPGRRVSISFPV